MGLANQGTLEVFRVVQTRGHRGCRLRSGRTSIAAGIGLRQVIVQILLVPIFLYQQPCRGPRGFFDQADFFLLVPRKGFTFFPARKAFLGTHLHGCHRFVTSTQGAAFQVSDKRLVKIRHKIARDRALQCGSGGGGWTRCNKWTAASALQVQSLAFKHKVARSFDAVEGTLGEGGICRKRDAACGLHALAGTRTCAWDIAHRNQQV